MIKVGIALPGISVEDIRNSASAAAEYPFESFSVYGDLGDLPPYAVLHASADLLRNSAITHIGPMSVPVGMQHPEIVATNALVLGEQLPGMTSLGLVRGAFMERIHHKPATLAELEETVDYIRNRFANVDQKMPPLYLGGFGPKLLGMAGNLAVKGVKLGGSTNPELAERTRVLINNPNVDVIMGAVTVIDEDKKAARMRARHEVAKYLAVVGSLDSTLNQDELNSLRIFMKLFRAGDKRAPMMISDSLLDKFSLAGRPEDALRALEGMAGKVDRFEFGTPHGLGTRSDAIRRIGETIVKELS